MKIFNFFIKKIFLRRVVIAVSILLLILLSNYLIFISSRSVVSTMQGYEEIKQLNQKNSYIANLDPESDIAVDRITKDNTQRLYDHLKEEAVRYGILAEGFVIDMPNSQDMEITCSYLNKEYYDMNKQFAISQGEELDFGYDVDDSPVIPVWVGKGLSESYPLGTVTEVYEPVLQRNVKLKVQGILEPNIAHSNMYSLSSKQYYNFSVIVPVNEGFIRNADIDFQLQSLFDIILIDTTKDKVDEFAAMIQDELGAKFNFCTQEENFEYFDDIFFSSMKIILVITVVLLVILSGIAVWSSLSSVRMMIKEFTINLFVGMQYSKLRKILYGYHGLLFLVNLLILLGITAHSRHGNWVRKDSYFCTFGFCGLISMDWIALLAVLVFDIILGAILVELMMWRIKKVPISLGVLQ